MRTQMARSRDASGELGLPGVAGSGAQPKPSPGPGYFHRPTLVGSEGDADQG